MKKIIIGVFAVMAISFNSCTKLPGCTDEDAENFNVDAESDDGTCTYSGSAVLYHDEETAMHLEDEGITGLRLYIDGSFWDVNTPGNYFASLPDCGDSDAMNMEDYALGFDQSIKFDYAINDQDDNELTTGSFTISGNSCFAVEYEY